MKANNYYIPLQYTVKVKKVRKNYLIRVILGEDFLIILLAFNWFTSHPLGNALGLLSIFISFWCIYEIGYIENDLVGKKFEQAPVLSSSYASYEKNFRSWQPWISAIVLATVGILVVQFANEPSFWDLFGAKSVKTWEISNDLMILLTKLAVWLLFLMLVRGLFRIYNYANKQTRVWLYSILQTCRCYGFLTIFQTNTLGIILLMSHTIARSIPYIIYRYIGGKTEDWPKQFPIGFFRFLLYIFLLVSLTIASPDFPLSLLIDKQAILIALFCLVRGSRHCWRVLSGLKPVWKDSSNKIY